MPKKYWLMKSEPEDYSIHQLKAEKSTWWTGVRNYQARNFMTRDMNIGDEVIFYHSNAQPPGCAGLAQISAKAEADITQFDSKSAYFEKRATREKPVWFCVEIKFVENFREIIPLAELRSNKKLEKMELLRKGSRLSIQPVAVSEFKEICSMAAAVQK